MAKPEIEIIVQGKSYYIAAHELKASLRPLHDRHWFPRHDINGLLAPLKPRRDAVLVSLEIDTNDPDGEIRGLLAALEQEGAEVSRG